MVMREKRRHATIALGVSTAVVLTVFLAGVYRGAVRGSLDYIEGTGADVWVGRSGTWNLMRTSGLLEAEAGDRAAVVSGVESVVPLLVALLPADLTGEPRTLLVLGVDASGATTPRRVATGVPTPNPGEIIVDQAFAARGKIHVGSLLTLAGRPLCVAGISQETNLLVTQYAFVHIKDLREMLGVSNRSTFLLCRAAPGVAPTVLARRLEDTIPGTAAFTAPDFLENNRLEIERGFLPVLAAMTVLGIAASVAIVALATVASVRERRAEFAVLLALGLRGSECALVVVEQSICSALAGGVGGLVVLAALERLLPRIVPEVEFSLEAPLAVTALAGAALTGVLGALASAREAGRVPPMEVFRR
jgi:hypothetical protein